ncbi:MAG: (Fe-S)-binding protein [Nitrospirae bacterium]|nr:(Fe-S)-binding protein [Nitrospirota bacterium]MBF0536398.1 (Fe-S)-binding protein [Nitrospirota bacterium]MBF0618320.1 (Fe-S)-binding protein [Nitrospirota bacterium]
MANDKTTDDSAQGDSNDANTRVQELIKYVKIKAKPVELTGEIKIPKIKPNSFIDVKPQLLTALEPLERLGYPVGGLVPNWKEVFLKKMDEILKKYRSVKLFLNICVRCGACTDKCHYFIGTADPNNMPVARAELMRKVYRRYFTWQGKLLGSKYVNGSDLSEELLAMWYTYFYQCSECRRCSVFCPYGIDTAEITMAAREILNSVGLVQKYVHEIIDKAQNIGNNLGMQKNAIINALEFVQDELQETTEIPDIRVPIDEEGADVLFVTPSADFFASPHIESLYGYAKVFHQAGISWTMSTHASEGGNFGLFIHNYGHMKKINKRIWEAARQLKVKRVIGGECGHMWRVLSSYSNTMFGPFDWLDSRFPRPQHICEFTLDLLKRGALKIDKTANDEFVVTMHDSCQVARGLEMGGTKYGQFEIPRGVIRGVCNRYEDMPDNTIKERTFCCGAGQGLLGDDMIATRVKGAIPRMQAYSYAKREKGVNFLALICAICKAQLSKMFPTYGIPMEEVGGIHQLVGRAIVLGAKEGI